MATTKKVTKKDTQKASRPRRTLEEKRELLNEIMELKRTEGINQEEALNRVGVAQPSFTRFQLDVEVADLRAENEYLSNQNSELSHENNTLKAEVERMKKEVEQAEQLKYENKELRQMNLLLQKQMFLDNQPA